MAHDRSNPSVRRPAARAVRLLAAVVLSTGVAACTRTCETCTPSVAPILAPTTCGNADAETFKKIEAAISGATGPPEVLLLSGGGSYGAWGAGFLNGWSDPSAPSDRPAFEVVTGSSTGAILGTWAFIGPRADACAKCAYTQTDDDTVYVKTFPWMWLQPWRWHEIKPWVSVKNLAPLRGMLEHYTAIEQVVDVARIYRNEGRMLLFGTVDIDLGGFCLWDMGKLAEPILDTSDETQRRRIYERYIDIVIASCSNPIVFNPAYIDGDMHVDGGVRHQIFASQLLDPIIVGATGQPVPTPAPAAAPAPAVIRFSPEPPAAPYCEPCSAEGGIAGARTTGESTPRLGSSTSSSGKDDVAGASVAALPPSPTDSDCIAGGKDGRPQVYAIINGPMVAPRLCTKQDIYGIGQRAMTVMEIQAMVGNLYQAKAQYEPKRPDDPRWNFCVSHIPNETTVWPYADTFPKLQMQALFAQAAEKARSADPWISDLPGGGISPIGCSTANQPPRASRRTQRPGRHGRRGAGHGHLAGSQPMR